MKKHSQNHLPARLCTALQKRQSVNRALNSRNITQSESTQTNLLLVVVY